MPHPISKRIEFTVVLLGGLWLALSAGYINTLMLVLGAPPVTHMTGSITRLSADVGQGHYHDAVLIGSLVVSFVLGAAGAGIIIGTSTLRLGRRYGIAILIESVILALAALTLPHSLQAAASLAACAAGLQNALAASYQSLIIRTTHLTGVLTDIGFSIGRVVTGHERPGWNFLLLGSIAVAFLVGGILGAIGGTQLGEAGLWIASLSLLVMGLGYFILRKLGRIGILDPIDQIGKDPEDPTNDR